MANGNAFGARLRELRKTTGRSMGEVARDVGISTVYYFEVETGKKRPFSAATVDFKKLAASVGGDPEELLHQAAEARGQLEVSLEGLPRSRRALMVRLAHKLSDGSLRNDQVDSIYDILGRG